MKAYDKEVTKEVLKQEAQSIKDLTKMYNEASTEMQDKITSLINNELLIDKSITQAIRNGNANKVVGIDHVTGKEITLIDQLESQLQAKIYQRQYQEMIQDQLKGSCDKLNNKTYERIDKYLKDSYDTGYMGSMYSVNKQGIPLTLPIKQDKVIDMITTTNDNLKLSSKLYSNINTLKDDLRQTISRGISQGSSTYEIAKQISKRTQMNLNNAIRIARTESNRVVNGAKLDFMHDAKDNGCDIVKEWSSMLDGSTRPTHQRLNGQLQEIDDPFKIDGMEAMHPNGFGIPSQDINCRCMILERAKWGLSKEELEALGNPIDAKDFGDFKEKAKDNSISLDNCKTNEDVSKYLKQKCNINANFSDMNLQNSINSAKGIEDALKDYPVLNSRNIKINSVSANDWKVGAIMDSSSTNNEIRINNSFYKKEEIVDNNKGWNIGDGNGRPSMYHETMHQLAFEIAENDSEYIDTYNKLLSSTKKSDWNKALKLADIGQYNFPINKLVREAIKNLDGKYLASDISKYASTNGAEFFAEAMTDCYYNGDQASELSKEFKRLIDEKLKSIGGK